MKEVNKADFLCLYLIPLIWYILAVSTCHLTIKLAMITTFKSAALPSNYFETSRRACLAFFTRFALAFLHPKNANK